MSQPKKIMKLYSGRFNWHGELHHLHTKAKSEERAFHNFISQLADTLRLKRGYVMPYFLYGENNYKIREGYFDKHE